MTYDLTILCLMRDSMPYMDRFIAQANGAFDHFEQCHLIICEGDSTDGTKQRLAQIAADDDNTVHADVTVIELDLKVQKMGNISHPGRWWSLETVWNENLKHVEPTKYAVCVESDLIWSWSDMKQMLDHIDANEADVAAPILMRNTPQTGHYHYDTNANRKGGKNLTNYPPYHPEWDNSLRLMPMDTVGGMLVMKGETLSGAVWKNNCVLHYKEGTRVVLDTKVEIFHP